MEFVVFCVVAKRFVYFVWRYRKKRSTGHHIVPVMLNRSGSSISPETVSSPSMENGMNSSRESPDEILRNGSNGTPGLSVQTGSGKYPSVV